MKAIILAAGYATRLYPLTENCPKPLLDIKGKPMINYIAEEIGTIDEIDEMIIISNNKFYPHFYDWAQKSGSDFGGKRITVLNDFTTDVNNRLGAIRDIQFCIDKCDIDEDVVIIAGDNLFSYRLKDSYDVFKSKYIDMVLAKVITDIKELQRMAVGTVDSDFIVTDLEEKPEHPKSDIAFFATYYYRRDTLPLIKEYLDAGNPPDSPGNFPAWLYKRKPVMAYIFDGECYDIGTVESYNYVSKNFTLTR